MPKTTDENENILENKLKFIGIICTGICEKSSTNAINYFNIMQ